MMDKLPGAKVYESFAYHVTLLRDFAKDDGKDPDMSTLSHSGRRRVSSRDRRSVRRQHSFTGGVGGGKNKLLWDDQSSNGSVRSARSLRGSVLGGKKNTTGRRRERPNSLNNGRMFGPSS